MNEFQKPPKDWERDALLRHLSTRLHHQKNPMPCPDDSRLAALAEGKIHGRERMELEDHLAACDMCRESFTLLRHLMPPVPERMRIFRPLALAASLVLVVMMVYVTSTSHTPRRESFVPSSSPVSLDEKITPPSTVEPDLRPAPPQHKAAPTTRESQKYKANPPAAFGAAERDKKSRPPGKRMQAPPVEEKSSKEMESSEVSEDTGALMTMEKSPAPATKRVRSEPARADTLQTRKGGTTTVSGIFPEPPPAGTPPGSVQFTLLLSEKGEITELIFDPETSLLVPPLRRALRQWSPGSTHRSGHLRFVAIWNGSVWNIQPSSISGGKRPGTSGT